LKNRRLIGSEVGPYLIQDKKQIIDTKAEARLSATTGNPLAMIEGNMQESIEGGAYNFYDDGNSQRSKSLNNQNEHQKSPNNALDFFGYHSSRANINTNVFSKESIIQMNNYKPQKRSISNETDTSPSYYKPPNPALLKQAKEPSMVK